MFRTALFRYNFRALMFHNWWLLVIPLAVSQLSVFWTAVTQRFTASLPANTVESISPLLAAFLCAHLLAPEYRSSIGAVLASKPVHIGKIVLLRLLIVMTLVWVLGLLSLIAFYFGLQPFPLLQPAVACLISSLFLGLFALTFATLLRHPLAGFGLATLYWLLDLPSGAQLNPYLSLKSLAASFPPVVMMPRQALIVDWWMPKGVLLIASLVLYAIHARLLFTLGSPLTVRRRRRALASAAAVIVVYLVTGACVKVAYAYRNQGRLFPNDAAWLRRQFAPFGPIPVAALFGPNFRLYLGDIPNAWRVQEEAGEADLLGDTLQHQRDVRRLLATAPNSLWAPAAADLLARFRVTQEVQIEERVSRYRILVDRYPNSPYTPDALFQIAYLYTQGMATDPSFESKARDAYELLMARYPNPKYSADALSFLTESDRRHGDTAAAERHAQQWVDSAPVTQKFTAWITLAEIRHDEGKTAEARQAAQQALLAVKEFRKALARKSIGLTATRNLRLQQDANLTESRAQKF